MAAPSHSQVLSEREEALAREVAEFLKPVLVEMNRKLDMILQKVEDMLAQLDIDDIRALLARLETATAAVQRDSAPALKGSQQ